MKVNMKNIYSEKYYQTLVLSFYSLVIYLLKLISYLLRTLIEPIVLFSFVLFLLSFFVKQMIAITEIIAIIGIITIRAIAPAPNVLSFFFKIIPGFNISFQLYVTF